MRYQDIGKRVNTAARVGKSPNFQFPNYRPAHFNFCIKISNYEKILSKITWRSNYNIETSNQAIDKQRIGVPLSGEGVFFCTIGTKKFGDLKA